MSVSCALASIRRSPLFPAIVQVEAISQFGGAHWTVPELLFEDKYLMTVLQLLLTGRQNDRPSTLNAVTEARLLSNKVL